MRWVMLLVLAGALLACGGDDGPSEEETDVREAAAALMTTVQNGQYNEAWAALHPAYQAVIPEEQLVDCGTQFLAAFVTFEIDDVELAEYNADEIGAIDAWQVGFSYELTDAFSNPDGSTGESNRTIHFVEDGDAWTWLPATGELQTFREGGCGLPWPGGSR
jgi:hypothetical protein